MRGVGLSDAASVVAGHEEGEAGFAHGGLYARRFDDRSNGDMAQRKHVKKVSWIILRHIQHQSQSSARGISSTSVGVHCSLPDR